MTEPLELDLSEQVIYRLRALYSRHGYTRYRMNKFEEYDFYANHKDFLLSDSVLTFTDANGALMALKPDVTLSIVKSSEDDPSRLQKLYYNENVYRAEKGSHGFRELMQVGLECIGTIDDGCIAEVVLLAARSLKSIHADAVLVLSHLDLLVKVLDALNLPENRRAPLVQAIGEKNIPRIHGLCADFGVSAEHQQLLTGLLRACGPARQVLPQIHRLLSGVVDTAAVDQLSNVVSALERSGMGDLLQFDFSMVDDLHYYNGILFKGFLRGLPSSVLSGGQYDNLMARLHRRCGAVGFAVYVDRVERLEAQTPEQPPESSGKMLNIALPKGRLGEKVYAMFEKAGYGCPAIHQGGRKLTFENEALGIRYFWVKPSDVAIYVERGAADIGVAGKDILLEYRPEVYELLDLGIGKCRMAVAARADFREDPGKQLRVATKFSNIAAAHYRARGRDIDIIHLNGSIEIAPILGLSDVIVDIVETGATLKENDLTVVETVVPISARLIANKADYQFKRERVEALVSALAARLEE